MLDSDTNGLFGNFSVAGKISAQRYRIISQQSSVLSGITRKVIVKDLFSPDDDDKYDNSIEEKIDVFNSGATTNTNSKITSPKSLLFKQQMKKSKSSSTLPISKKKTTNNVSSNKKKKIEEEPSCTKYNPKMEYIWNKTITGPKWKTIRGRQNHISYDDKDFYINHEDISTTNKKGFIEMSKQTARNGFPVRNDLRIRYEKKYVPEPLNDKIKPKHKLILSRSQGDLFNNNNEHKTEKKQRHFDFNVKKIRTMPPSTRNCLSPSYSCDLMQRKCLLVPDFRKTISREKVNQIKNQKKIDIPFTNPEHTPVFERPVMMVFYDKRERPKKKDFKGVDPSLYFNIDKVFEKYNNHKHSTVPIFKKMISRPMNDKDPLPSYMKKIYTRASGYSTTDKTLKMNNFSNGKYMTGYTSFFPKRSFNANINYALLNSDKIDVGLVENKSEFGKLGTYLSRTMRFYQKDIEDIMKEHEGNKFDNVTYKTIRNEDRRSSSESKRIIRKIDNMLENELNSEQ